MRNTTFILVVLLLCLCAAPTLAQNKVRVEAQAIGDTFTIDLKSSSIYVVDPFPYEWYATPEAEISEGACIWSADVRPLDRLSAHTAFRTLTSGCTIVIKISKLGKATNSITLLRSRKHIQIALTNEWQKVKLGKGTYTQLFSPGVFAEIDRGRYSDGCNQAVDGGRLRGISSYIDATQGERVSILAGDTAWYRILTKPCTTWMRAHDGQTGTLTLLKLSSKAIWPPN